MTEHAPHEPEPTPRGIVVNRGPAPSAVLHRIGALLSTLLVLLAPAQARAEVILGLALSATGPMASRSQAFEAAATEAVARINAAGGLLGETVRIVTADDNCSDAGAVGAAKALAAANARLVVGHLCEKAALAAATVYGPAGIIVLATATRHPALTEKRAGKTIFRLAGREDRQGEAAGHWLADTAKAGRVAIVQDRTAYARGLTAGATAALKARGVLTPHIFPIVASEKSYAPVIAGITGANIEAVYFAGYPAEALIILDGLRKAGAKPQFLGCDALAATDFAGAPVARQENVRVMLRPETLKAASSDPVASAAAAAITIWAEAATRVKAFDGASVAADIASHAFNPGLGPWKGSVSFDEKGDARIPAFVAGVWTGETWTMSAALPAAPPPP